MIFGGRRGIWPELFTGWNARAGERSRSRRNAALSMTACEYANWRGGEAISSRYPWGNSDSPGAFYRCAWGALWRMRQWSELLRRASFLWMPWSTFTGPGRLHRERVYMA